MRTVEELESWEYFQRLQNRIRKKSLILLLNGNLEFSEENENEVFGILKDIKKYLIKTKQTKRFTYYMCPFDSSNIWKLENAEILGFLYPSYYRGFEPPEIEEKLMIIEAIRLYMNGSEKQIISLH